MNATKSEVTHQSGAEGVESPVHVTFDKAGSGSAGAQQTNSETVTDAIIKALGCKLRAVSGNSFDALKAHMEIGGDLRELKPILGHGNFDRAIKEHLGIKKQWRARLMKLNDEWPDILTAFEWANANGRLTSEYSVDRALALLKVWRREVVNADGSGSTTAKNFSDDSFVSNGTIRSKSEYLKLFAIVLLFELLKARALIAFLKSEIERLSEASQDDAPCPDQLVLALGS